MRKFIKESVMQDDYPTNTPEEPVLDFVGKKMDDDDIDKLSSVEMGPELIIPISSDTIVAIDEDEYDKEDPELAIVNDEKFTKADEDNLPYEEAPELNISDNTEE